MSAPLPSDRPAAPFLLRERVRWADVDHVQIMRFSAYTRLLELAEQEFFRDLGFPYDAMFEAPTVWMPRRRLEIDYLGPARIDDELELATWIGRVGERSYTMRVDVGQVRSGQRIAAMSLAVVCVDVQSFRPVPIPEAWRARVLAGRGDSPTD
jgi:acyl-CoA thioester hydrolase